MGQKDEPNRGIRTTGADGTHFRSRLEARWAYLFDAIGWQWEYEPFDLDGYIPDFAILGELPLLIEVKPALSLEELRAHTEKAELANRDLLIVGGAPILPDGYVYQSVGVMLQWDTPDAIESIQPYMSGATRQAWIATGHWHRCEAAGCGQVAIHHHNGGWWSYPCGHAEGDHYLGLLDPEELTAPWALGRNATQWVAGSR